MDPVLPTATEGSPAWRHGKNLISSYLGYQPPPPPPPELLLLPPPLLRPPELLDEGFATPAAMLPTATDHAPLAPAPPKVPPPPVQAGDELEEPEPDPPPAVVERYVAERDPREPIDLNQRSIFGPSPNASR